MPCMNLNGREVGDGHPPYVVAEIGQNHNGDVYTALRMIGMANRCGVNAVKFQLRNAAAEYCCKTLDAPHPNPRNAFGDTYREHRAAIDLKASEIEHLADRIRYNEWPLTWFCTPCWDGGVAILEDMGCPFYKVASKDLENYELLREIYRTGKPVILSTGMHGYEAIDTALELFGKRAIVLHCVSKYPCPVMRANLDRMDMIRDRYGGEILTGYSDHTEGTAVCEAAIKRGAAVIEKHVTLNRRMKGTDQILAADEIQLKRIVQVAAKATVGDTAGV